MALFDHGYNWDAWSHKDLHKMIHGESSTWFGGDDGAGVANVSEANARWARFTAIMADAKIQTDAALARAGASWEGGAADSMSAGVTPLSQWTVDANEAGHASSGGVDQFSSSYSSAQRRMPEPVEVDSTANSAFGGIPAGFTHLFGGQTDQDKQEAQAQQAKQEAVRVMSGYQSDTSTAQSGLGQFVPPPSVTVSVPAPSANPGEIKTGDGSIVGPPGTDSHRRGISEPAPHTIRDTAGPTGSSDTPTHGVQQTTSSSATPTIQSPPSTGGNPPGTGSGLPPGTKPSPTFGGPYLPGSLPGGSGPATPGGGRGSATGSGTGRGGQGGGGQGSQSGQGSQAGQGRGTGRGPMAGVGGLGAAEGHTTGRGGAATGRPGSPMGGGMGAGGAKGDGDEDGEHFAADYLHGTHDDFWDDGPVVAPPVIGA
ncbi:PPE domain-containing protein [Actinokineospora sp.]|uniref:PPE domain-containing protein n=1 Tax=Actinokineospora sp. TaxID=1872133 RepID=UPI003D6B52AA